MTEMTLAILRAALSTPDVRALSIMRLSLVDWLSVGWAGRDEPVSQINRNMVLDEGGVPAATLFGGGRGPMRSVALANGAASHALDYDDTHFAHIGHPSVAVIPAALAVAEARGASREAMLRAALAGCEASIRFGLAFGRGHYQAGFHQTGTAGAFGAAVASAKLLNCDMEQTLALVSTRASGLKSQFGTMGKPYNAGIAAANGVEAALLANAGMVSSADAIEGPSGFLATHQCDGDVPDSTEFFMHSISHKYHACCHGLHATLEAIETLKPIAVQGIRSVRITTHPRWMTVCNKTEPKTGLEAKFSYRAVVAASLLGHDTARLDTFSDELWSQPDVIEMRSKVSVSEDDTLSETEARVEFDLTDGIRAAKHDLANVEPYEMRADRIRAKSEALLGKDHSTAVWDVVHGPDAALDSLTALMV